MKLYEVFFGLFVATLFLLGIFVGNSTCACGDLPQPDETIKQIKGPTI